MPAISVNAKLKRIDTLARRDPGRRGFPAIAGEGNLREAAETLLQGERILVVTGFCIRSAMIGENDGLSGSLALADALRQLGKTVTLVTDQYSSALLAAGSAPFGQSFSIVSLSQDQVLADREIDTVLQTQRPTQVVAIERPGSAIDGHRYSMGGERLDDIVPAADRLLMPPFARDYATIAIGDGGNELGLGSLRERLKDRIDHGALVFCATPADYVIPAGISNWGAHALTAAISLLSGRALLRPPIHERLVLEALLAAGAVDGRSRKRELSVDGVAWDEYAQTLTAIHREIDIGLGKT